MTTRRWGALATIVILMLALAGCGDDDDTPAVDGGAPDGALPDGGSVADASTCTKRWTTTKVGALATSSATVTGGALVLRSTNNASTDVRNLKAIGMLTGDFDARFEWEGWVAGGMGAFVQASAAKGPTGAFVTSGAGNVPTPGLGVAFQNPTGAVDIKATAATGGSFRIQRAGGMVTTSATAAGGTPVATANQVSGSEVLEIGLQIVSNMTSFAAETSIRVTAFTLTGGGGQVASDSFDCDSIQP